MKRKKTIPDSQIDPFKLRGKQEAFSEIGETPVRPRSKMHWSNTQPEITRNVGSKYFNDL